MNCDCTTKIVTSVVTSVVVVTVIAIFSKFYPRLRLCFARQGNVENYQNAALDETIPHDVGGCKNEAARERDHVPPSIPDNDIQEAL